MREITDELTDAGREVLQNIADHKVHVMHVTGEAGAPSFAYTVGLWHHYEQPEVIVFGLEVDAADELLHHAADACAEGARFAPGDKRDDLLVGFAVRFLGVARDVAGERLGAASWAYEDAAFDSVQLVWPDKQRRWPWEEGVRKGFSDLQPLLGPRP